MTKKMTADDKPNATQLQCLGAKLRARRKSLGVSAVVTSEAAGLSRVTLHRIEKGEPSVTMGAWHSVASVLGMQFKLEVEKTNEVDLQPKGWWPVRIALADYPQLKALAWQVQGTDYLTPVEAHDIYERNARHLDLPAMREDEHELWQALQQAFDKKTIHV
jgi:transcriptional regulator with XRE-family HTH domain